jgi:hypothetical protein
MGFLANDTNNIILDAVLTNEGRKRLAANNGTFRIVQYSFGDDEVDYKIIQKYGRTVGREKIEKNTPVLEALTNSSIERRNLLVTLSNDGLTALSTYALSSESVTLTNAVSRADTSGFFTAKQQGAAGQTIPTEIRDTVAVVSLNSKFLTLANATPFARSGNIEYFNVAVNNPNSDTPSFQVNIQNKVLTTADFTTFGATSDKTSINTVVRVQGRQSGLIKDVQVTLNKN